MAEYGVYNATEKLCLDYGAKVVVDSAFNVGLKSYIIKSAQQDPQDVSGLLANRATTSVCSFLQLKEHYKVGGTNDRLIVL